MLKSGSAPKVIVGLPVYNGENYLGTAIDSILSQTYENFELIISDNASTDSTEEICRYHAARDTRVRHYRHSVNLGAAANFNRVFELAQGEKYFKWAAHDDWIAPAYLEACVRELEAQPDAVLCQSVVEIIDDTGQCRETYDHSRAGTSAPRLSDRFRARLEARRCTEIFGVIRADTLASTNLIGNHLSADRTLLLELALRGRFLLIPQPLFFNREHEGRFIRRGYAPREELAWYAPGVDRRIRWKTWTLYGKCLGMVGGRVERRSDRLRCYGHMLRSLKVQGRWKRLMLEPLMALSPGIASALVKQKRTKRLRGGQTSLS